MNRQQKRDNVVVCIADLEREATCRLPKEIGEYYNEGSMDLITLRDNKAAYDRYRLRPRVCRNISKIDPSTDCWGTKARFPIGFAPAAMHKMAHPDGEMGTSRAAAKAGVNMILSHYATTSIEDVVEAGSGYGNGYAMQLCLVEDWPTNYEVLRRAENAGCKAFVITCDCSTLGRRLNEYRNNFSLPSHLTFPNIPQDVDVHGMVTKDPRVSYNTEVDWDQLKQFISSTTLEVYLKGITTAEDALEAEAIGAAGVIVSTHGGRQLDTVVSALDALPEIVDALGGRIKVHIDSGIRRGSDIFKALALGADHCWVGRIPIWGLAYKGEEGVSIALQLLYDEFITTMALCGCSSIGDINRAHLGRLNANGEFIALVPRVLALAHVATVPKQQEIQFDAIDKVSTRSNGLVHGIASVQIVAV